MLDTPIEKPKLHHLTIADGLFILIGITTAVTEAQMQSSSFSKNEPLAQITHE
ncbi:MAG: hypothetical protein GWP17_04905 [Aquificales bacterium]|nr:hypothetical protein [Aquificales bacterium]